MPPELQSFDGKLVKAGEEPGCKIWLEARM